MRSEARGGPRERSARKDVAPSGERRAVEAGTSPPPRDAGLRARRRAVYVCGITKDGVASPRPDHLTRSGSAPPTSLGFRRRLEPGRTGSIASGREQHFRERDGQGPAFALRSAGRPWRAPGTRTPRRAKGACAAHRRAPRRPVRERPKEGVREAMRARAMRARHGVPRRARLHAPSTATPASRACSACHSAISAANVSFTHPETAFSSAIASRDRTGPRWTGAGRGAAPCPAASSVMTQASPPLVLRRGTRRADEARRRQVRGELASRISNASTLTLSASADIAKKSPIVRRSWQKFHSGGRPATEGARNSSWHSRPVPVRCRLDRSSSSRYPRRRALGSVRGRSRRTFVRLRDREVRAAAASSNDGARHRAASGADGAMVVAGVVLRDRPLQLPSRASAASEASEACTGFTGLASTSLGGSGERSHRSPAGLRARGR